jgi:multimeric flavodoxin WrbA
MSKKILILSGSPVKNGNTHYLIKWFSEGAKNQDTEIEIINTSTLKNKTNGCTSCRSCQKIPEYKCILNDDVSIVLEKMQTADVIVIATPLYFFSASAQIKLIFDRMFSLYKWDNKAGTMKTILKGKTLVLLASAYEDIGLDALAKPFILTADYSGMKFESLLVPNAGVSGELKNKADIRQQAILLGEKIV